MYYVLIPLFYYIVIQLSTTQYSQNSSKYDKPKNMLSLQNKRSSVATFDFMFYTCIQ